ncbi:MAG: sugar phosphate isomerase/epimerase [Phycisphaeraceae bacterium]|nr:sugar phosphate isomerase/epimerase [Phycisphaeraceae bacterium]
MARTRTGSFPIGFRRGWSDWQRSLPGLIEFARKNDFEAIDVGPMGEEELKTIPAAGLKIGSVDLTQWTDLFSPDAGKRRAAVEANAQLVKMAVKLGVKAFFCVIIPEDAKKPRQENFDLAVDSFSRLTTALAGTGAKIVLEGWPGNGANLACTPADYRAVLKAVGGDVLGVNFDPSHLIRMGIDPVRFVAEFAPKVYHVHGKDTEILEDELYEHGNYQPATFAKGHGFGGQHWRYTLPGHGCARWTKMFSILKDAGYKGYVSIELEDENFNGSEEGEKRGLIASRDYLASV